MDNQQLRTEFLECLYDIQQADLRPMVQFEQVAEHMQKFIPADNQFVSRLERIADYLAGKGYVETHSDKRGPRLLSITSSGTDFIESVRESRDSMSTATDTVPDWSSLRQQLLYTIYDEANGDLQKFVSIKDVCSRLNMPKYMQDKIERCIGQLAASGLVTVEVDEGGLYLITMEGMRVVEGNRREQEEPTGQIMNSGSGTDLNGRTVFVVHGRNELLKSQVQNTLYEIELNPVLLDAQANNGKTIVEKFEASSDVVYAVIVATADDVGVLKSEFDSLMEKLKSSSGPLLIDDVLDQVQSLLETRPRQNVLFEYGYFSGMLGRDRCCILLGDEVELPSDLAGLGYVSSQSSDWKYKLGREIKEAGIDVDLNHLS